MSRIRGLAFAQRVVTVIGLGMLLGFVAVYVATEGFRVSSGSWFAYAPGTDYSVWARPGRVRTFVIPVALIAIWTVTSVWLLGNRRSSDG